MLSLNEDAVVLAIGFAKVEMPREETLSQPSNDEVGLNLLRYVPC